MHNPLKWSAELLSSLYEQGAEFIIISPGSRSTPLTLAAAFHPHFKKKIVLDERSAAFMALGIGKATGKPAILICTSGTALANYFPAIVEAKESATPLIILSADRPPMQRETGSSQTISQLKIFGDYAVFFHEAGEPNLQLRDLARIKYAAKQAFDFSISKGGASQINLPFRKPLEPDSQQVSEIKEIYQNSISALSDNDFNTVHPGKNVLQLIENSLRPLLICGPANRSHQLQGHVEKLAEKLKAPVLSEPGSGTESLKNMIHRYDQFLRKKSTLKELSPDLIIRFGGQPYTQSLLMASEAWKNIPVIHITPRQDTQDHALSVTHTINLQKSDQIDLIQITKKTDARWLNLWFDYDKQATSFLLKSLDEPKTLTDGHVFSHFANLLGKDWNVMLSNSFPVRDMALFGESMGRQFVNRGAAGIDGITSTALGIHWCTDKPTCCITGDLAFIHDSNALLSIKQSNQPFLIVVINNGGGTIFRMLPVYQSESSVLGDEHFTRYFETPQHMSIKYLAMASEIDYFNISLLDELHSFKREHMNKSAIVECITNARDSMELRQKLWDF